MSLQLLTVKYVVPKSVAQVAKSTVGYEPYASESLLKPTTRGRVCSLKTRPERETAHMSDQNSTLIIALTTQIKAWLQWPSQSIGRKSKNDNLVIWD